MGIVPFLLLWLQGAAEFAATQYVVILILLNEFIKLQTVGHGLPARRLALSRNATSILTVELHTRTLTLHLLYDRVSNGSYESRVMIFLVIIDDIQIYLNPLDHMSQWEQIKLVIIHDQNPRFALATWLLWITFKDVDTLY